MLSPATGAYRHRAVRANSGKRFWRLLKKSFRAACRRLREVWATQIPTDSTKPIGNSATTSPPDIGILAGAIGGGSQRNQDLRSLPVEGDLGAVTQIEQADLGSSDLRKPWILKRWIHPSKISGTVSAIGEKIALVKQAEPDKIRRTLEEALQEHPAPTLTELSRRLGYSTSTVLRAHEPDLCDQLATRRRSHTKARRTDLERIAMAALRETPAPSVRDLCKRLGVSLWFMNKYFPAVRTLVAERHRQCFSAETTRRRETMYRDVHSIAAELRSLNVHPSANRIVEQLPEGSCREWKAVALAIRQAHNVLASQSRKPRHIDTGR